MIKDSFNSIGGSARGLLRNWGGLALLNALYAALLVSAYVFFATGVANAWQLTLSAATALAAPLLFFVLQAAIANFAQGDVRLGPLTRRTLRDFLKVLLLSLPLIALAVGLGWLLLKLPAHLPKMEEAAPHSFVHATLHRQHDVGGSRIAGDQLHLGAEHVFVELRKQIGICAGALAAGGKLRLHQIVPCFDRR